MRSTKQYGLVNSWQEHQMLVHAEHTYEERQKGVSYTKHGKPKDNKQVQS